MRLRPAGCVLLVMAVPMQPAFAWPERPVRVVIPFAPGGGTDATIRIIADAMKGTLGQPLVLDNRPGASTIIGTEIVAKSKPDGYTVLLVTSTFAINPSLQSKMPYDPVKDFAPITLVARTPYVMVVHPSLPVRTVKELVALARAQPGKLTFGSAGNGTAVHLAGEQLRSVATIDLQHVPYKGAGQSIGEVLGGQITMVFTTPSGGRQHAASGRLRALGITSPKRFSGMPDVPTFGESGFAAVDAATINGLVGPARLPRDYVQRVNEAVMRGLQRRETQERLQELGFDVAGGTPAQFGSWIATETAKWAKVVKESGAKPE